MIRGMVDGRRQAWVPVEPIKSDGGVQSVNAVIDTGFNGYLTLPLEVIESLGFLRDDLISVRLAGGVTARRRTWNGQVLWHGRIRSIQVIESPGVPLLGMFLLADSEITIRVRVGGAVVIEEIG